MDRKPVKIRSYANIAIIKYWGKEDTTKMVPSTSSISLTLENMITETQLSPLDSEAKSHVFYLDGTLQSLAEQEKIGSVIEQFKPADETGFVRIDTHNNMPTAAGLSSSSSGLSALVLACNEYYQLGLNQGELAQRAKFASGSSSRSFFGPIAGWDKETGQIFQVQTDLKLAMIMLVLNDQKKSISSREGMKRCMETSTNFEDWVRQSEQDYQDMLLYLKNNEFKKVGELTEKNALLMHSTTETASPSFSYLTEESYQAMDFVKQLRKKGEQCYFTMDAGPNVKVLCLEEDLDRLVPLFKQNYRVIVSKTKELNHD
ncbi:Diphosphomevalonate decarboxylase [Streptococcus sp. DD10]|uniref:diphosphomevalonate decarboxylase n=1 Tax=Streptococcus sp. DD10 TaxID=1777878 RepID=UPI000799D4A6|nr:diphosphomevalonate decarboxylase [Streptococcus sp. DD10]KXT74782.1 Diphosphomevalonate decarboxylase [Streptococcus sp. DD10]